MYISYASMEKVIINSVLEIDIPKDSIYLFGGSKLFRVSDFTLKRNKTYFGKLD